MAFSRARGIGSKVIARRGNGDLVHYNFRTRQFLVQRADGVIRTYFKPSSASYGRRQLVDAILRR
jgi:hypothetical protein